MCAVSMIGDDYQRRFPSNWPWAPTTIPFAPQNPGATNPLVTPTRQEFEALKKEVEELRELLKAAKKYDEATGQPDCEMDEKVAFIKQLGAFLGVDMSEVFGNA